MTRKRFIKLVTAMSEKVYAKQGGHLTGKNLKYYRNYKLSKIYKSYAEAGTI